MVNGTRNIYQPRFAPPAVRPAPKMGAMGDLSVLDWAMLGGGAIVVGSGLTAFIKGMPARKRRADLLNIVVGGVVALVGGTTFVQEFKKIMA